MRQNLIQLCLTAVALLLSSCSECALSDDYGRTIVFSQRVSRAASLQMLDGRSFGVRGYCYDKTWADAAPVTKPHPDWKNVKIDVSHNGICSYNSINRPLQWEPQKNYSFFAYHPFPAESHGPMTLSGVNQSQAPVLTYQLHQNALTDMNFQEDLMYACAFDENESITSTVGLNFRHCLFGLQMVIINLNEYEASDPKQGIEISKLLFKIDRVEHQQIKIPLDGSPVTCIPFSRPQGARYDYLSGKRLLVPSTLNESYFDVMKDNHLMLIPQKGLTGAITVVHDGKSEEVPVDFSEVDFQAGTRYLFGLQFIGDQVNAVLVSADAWTDITDHIEFE